MFDQPPKHDPLPEKPEFTGGWRAPQTPSVWRPAQRSEEPEAIWHQPALPTNVQAVPTAEGEWHLPRPEDTIFTAQDVIAVREPAPGQAAPRPERPDELALIEAARAAAGLPLTEVEAAPAPEDDVEAESRVEPEAEIDMDLSDSQSLLELEEASREMGTTDESADEDEDDDAFSMSELVALASLVEQPPKATIVPGQTAEPPAATAEQPAIVEDAAAAADPAEYARRQLERIGQTGPQPAAPGAPAADDPASYARQRLEELGISGGAAAPVAPAAPGVPAAPLTPEQLPLAQRFQETQQKVRGLRQQFRQGQITRDQLQAELRRLMILDDNRVWWMMGLETDTWYRFENGDWVAAAPPVSLAAGPERGFGAGEYTLDKPLEGSLPRLPTDRGPAFDATQPSEAFRTPAPTGGFEVDESPLPRVGVPITDPDRTMVGTVGAYLEPELSPGQPTRPGASFVQETRVGEYAGIPAPGPDEELPDYDLNQAAPIYDEFAQRARRRSATSLLTLAAVGVGAVLLLFACGIGFILIQYSNIANQWQSQIAALADYQPEFQTVRILDVNGDSIAELTSEQGGARTDVALDKISPFVIHAVVSLENERFFEDPGWDWIAIFRAFLQNLSGGQVESGASTITQQIARQLVLKDSTVSPERKLQEIIIASQIAQRYTKNEILELYLNEIYFGNQSYGVEAAARFYFSKSANDLNLPEAALLAGMIAAPATYDPVRRGGEDLATYSARRDATLDRMKAVINRMVEVGCLQFQHAPYLNQPFCIDQTVVRQAAAQQADVEARNYRPREVTYKYPHFVKFVQQIIERDYGADTMYRRGFVIRTTLNPRIQDVAQTALTNQIRQLATTGINTGAIMVTDPRTGAIRAMVGSPDFNNEEIDGQVNGALTFQQPGSAIKPVVYTGALEGVPDPNTGQLRYLTPASILWDVPTTFNTVPPYSPVNFDGQFRGPIAVRSALQNSINVAAVKAFDFIGAAKFQDVAGRLGLTFPDGAQFGLATALGAVDVRLYDMMVAYGTLANNGVRVPLYLIESITDASGTPVPTTERPASTQVIQPSVAYLMQNILSDDNARAAQFGAGGWMTIEGLPRSNYVAAKTGTTNQNRDLWTMGFTTNAVVGVWMGRPDNNPTFVQGGGYNAVAPIWNQVMLATLRTMPAPSAFTVSSPGSVVEIQICGLTGTLPPPNCPALRNELFLASQQPPAADQAFVRRVAIDTWTGFQANQYCPDNQIEGTYVNISDQAAVAWLKSPAGAAVAQQLGLTGGTLESVPSVACDLNTEIPIARITSPADGQPVSGLVQVTGAASATTFNRYQLEVARAGSTNFQIISGPSTVPQTSGILGTWDTGALAAAGGGQYTLRLAMFSNSGGYLYRTVTVVLPSVQPTAIPTVPLPVLPTPPFQETTPLPFDEMGP